MTSGFQQFCSEVSLAFSSMPTPSKGGEGEAELYSEGEMCVCECMCECVWVCMCVCRGVLGTMGAGANNLLQGGFHFWPHQRCGEASPEGM